MSEARVIKRYANRKLYDTQHSRYVTLDQIAEMIRSGDDVKIIDNKSKEDLTSVTLAQIIFEEEKRQKSFLPLQAMRNIIQSGGESITQLVSQAKGRVSQILPRKNERRDEDGELLHPDDEEAMGGASPSSPGDENGQSGQVAGARADAVVGSGEILTADFQVPPPTLEAGEASGAAGAGAADVDDEAGAGRRVVEGLRNLREFREFLTHSQRTIDDWQRKVDGRIRHVFEGISPFATLQKDIGALSSRIAQLEAKLTQLVHEDDRD